MGVDEELVSGHVQEIRRGTVVLACLSVLEEPHYGYALLDILGRAGFEVDANTLYPLLRRLDKQGLLAAEWNTDESRPRKYYALSPAGRQLRDELAREWAELDGNIRHVLRGGER